MESANIARSVKISRGYFIMAAVLLSLGFFLIWPVLLILINSFNTADDWLVDPRVWGFDHWFTAFTKPDLLITIWNSVMIWGLTAMISFPIGVAIAWTLARTRIPWSRQLEFLFWVAYMVPSLPVTIAWINLLDPYIGFINVLLMELPFIDEGPFNIFSVEGIVWVNLMGNGIVLKVMLLTPAFRNMDAAMEEAARVSGAGNLRTAFRVTLPLMISPMVLVLALQLLRVFQSFETELLLGEPFRFYVYSTKIYALVRTEIPNYGEAAALAAVTMGIIALIIPLQRWIIQRRRYTTLTGSFKPGLVDFGNWNYVLFAAIVVLLVVLSIMPVAVLVLGSFMTRIGYFELGFTLDHWRAVLNNPVFSLALQTTLVIASVAAIASPLLFSVIAYILVRTNLPWRVALDWVIWGSGAIPGILAGLGLLWIFLGTPGLGFLYGSIWALILVVILQGNTTGVNVLKGVFVQVGADMEEAARASGAGWIRTYFRIWLPLLMPTLALLAVLNFVSAAGVTSAIILLASRETITLSLLALRLTTELADQREAASIVSIFIVLLTVGMALPLRALSLRLGVRHDVAVADAAPQTVHAAAGMRPQAAG
ncbi:MAG: iron ABC transporter permease [Proteobacteria bacterium]|nr:iron ABC transporter permease [Pseudomonadota bacterium]